MSRVYVVLLISLFILLLAAPIYAVDEFKVSEFGGAHQIWFQAEAFDDRDPDSANTDGVGFKLVAAETTIELPAGAYGDAIVDVSGNDSVWLLYNFDISATGGSAGTWYIWSREINPSNQSEYLWVLGDDGNEIPTVKPAFDNDDDRIFDANAGPPWAWNKGNREGEEKELQNGMNTMMIWYRQGNETALRDVFVWTDNPDYTPTDDDYMNATTLTPSSVKPLGKLTTSWGAIKDMH